jgi:redox-sensitive bicupin YhaK (pirin superfamily)
MKKVLYTRRSDTPHWVGDGFPARSIFSYNDLGKELSPFLLLDYLGPVQFPPSKSEHRRGVGEHPHRGFETVSIIFSGEVEHRDSSGGGGVIKAGDVQWMTAGSGLVHDEFHGKNISEKGGLFHGIQLWVNLPKKDKLTQPKYQGITKEDILDVNLPDQAGTMRIIAGDYLGTKGPASTFSPINIWDIKLSANKPVTLKVPAGHTAALFVVSGSVAINSQIKLNEADIAVLEREGDTFIVEASKDSHVMFLGGEDINEPIVGYGPFVMNTQAEIGQAIQDFQEGKMGHIR